MTAISKTLVRATAIGCLLVVGACRDGTSADPAPTFTGRWAGEPWTGDAAASLIDVESAADTVEIIAYGGPGGAIEGRVSFEAQPARAATPYGPSARFENGWFRATINRFPR